MKLIVPRITSPLRRGLRFPPRPAMPLLLFAAVMAVWPVKGSAQEDYEHNLAREEQNPLSPLITVPLVHDWDFKMGPLDQGEQYRLVFRPSVPISLNEDWRLITRVFVPYITQEDVLKGPLPSFPGVPENLLGTFPKEVRKAIEQAAERGFNRDVKKLFPVDHHQDGLSDITQNIFFSPKKPAPGGIIWGIGPVLRFPTATDHRLGRQQWGAGPALALVKQKGPWSFVIGADHLWSLHGKKDREDLNTTFVSSVVSYTTQKQFTVGVDADAFYEWSTNQWLVPINFEVSQIVKVGDLPVQFLAGVRYYADGPSGAPEWGLRFTIAPIFREWIRSGKKKTER